MADIELHIYPDPLLIANEMRIAADEIDLDPGPMGDSLAILMASIDRSFMEEGPGWEPWATSYRDSVGSPHGPLPEQETILIRTAAMAAATQDPGNYVITENRIEWDGSETPDYTDYHLTGTEKMPERNFLRWDAIARREIRDTWTNWLERKITVVKG